MSIVCSISSLEPVLTIIVFSFGMGFIVAIPIVSVIVFSASKLFSMFVFVVDDDLLMLLFG